MDIVINDVTFAIIAGVMINILLTFSILYWKLKDLEKMAITLRKETTGIISNIKRTINTVKADIENISGGLGGGSDPISSILAGILPALLQGQNPQGLPAAGIPQDQIDTLVKAAEEYQEGQEKTEP